MLNLTSPAFDHNGMIPEEYTCDGLDNAPELTWQGAPWTTLSFVLVCDDPDVPENLRDHAPDLVWDHWVVFNIPNTCTKILKNEKKGPKGSICGTNSYGKTEWGGPCPPNPVAHRYFFKLFALDCILSLDSSTTKTGVLEAIKSHVLDETVLIGKYLRKEFTIENSSKE